jgi:hypothetical protein
VPTRLRVARLQEALSAQLRQLPALAELAAGGGTRQPPRFAARFDARDAVGSHSGGGDDGGDERDQPAVRAARAHALALADARVGSKWWLALRRAERAQGGGGGGGGGAARARLDEAAAREGEEDRLWRAQWERVLREEAARPSGLPARRPPLVIEYSLESCAG